MRKRQIELPQGARPRAMPLKNQIEFPEGRRAGAAPFKEQVEFPEQQEELLTSGGFEGLAVPTNPATRELGFLSHVKNLIRDEGTAATTRPGKELVGDGPVDEGKVWGLANAYTPDRRHLIAAVESDDGYVDWWVWDGTEWETFHEDLNKAPIHAAQISDQVVISNGDNAPQLYDIEDRSIEEISDAPEKGNFATAGYNRVFLADTPGHLAASDLEDPKEWTEGDSAYIAISPDDGDTITHLRFYQTNLYIFKRSALFELHGPERGRLSGEWQAFRVHGAGTPNGRTVAEIDGALYWLAETHRAVVAWGGGEQPQVVSQPVEGLIRRINWEAIDEACAGTDAYGRYLLSVPLDDDETPRHVLVYDTRDESWWVWEGLNATAFSTFRKEDREEFLVFGDPEGRVFTMEGETDLGEPIPWEAVVGPAVLGSTTHRKRVRRAYVVASGRYGQTIYAATSDEEAGPFSMEHPIHFESYHASRIREQLPLRETTHTGGYVYRLRLRGEGPNTLYEVGFNAGVRGG